jgi:hypothetical protein
MLDVTPDGVFGFSVFMPPLYHRQPTEKNALEQLF